MSSISRSPSLEPVQSIKQKKASKVKSKKKSTNSKVVAEEHGKDEGTNPDWDYVPPEGTVLVDHHIDCEDFDWDAVKNNEDFELWLVRVPESVSLSVMTCSLQHLKCLRSAQT